LYASLTLSQSILTLVFSVVVHRSVASGRDGLQAVVEAAASATASTMREVR